MFIQYLDFICGGQGVYISYTDYIDFINKLDEIARSYKENIINKTLYLARYMDLQEYPNFFSARAGGATVIIRIQIARALISSRGFQRIERDARMLAALFRGITERPDLDELMGELIWARTINGYYHLSPELQDLINQHMNLHNDALSVHRLSHDNYSYVSLYVHEDGTITYSNLFIYEQ